MQNQPWTGYKANKQTALPEKPNHPFWLMHHPMTCWELVQIEDDHFWLPTFRKLFDMPGCNAVRMVQNGRGADSTMARVQMMDNGFEILDLEFGYQQRFPSRFGGHIYKEIWTTPKVIGNRVIWNYNHKEYDLWRKQLLDDGIIEKPDPDVLDILIERQERRIERNAQRGHIPHIQKQIVVEEKKLSDMQKAKDLLYNVIEMVEQPLEKPKRGRKKKDDQ